MFSQPKIYGFDLITDATGDSIDPLVNRIVAVGISTDCGDELYDGDESEIISMVDTRLGMLDTGVISCWLGSLLAFPMFAARSEINGVSTGLRMFQDERDSRLGPVERLAHPWLVSWHDHAHVDLEKLYSTDSRKRIGFRQKEASNSVNPATNPLIERKPETNARLTRSLTDRRWSQAKRLVDRLPDREGSRSVLAAIESYSAPEPISSSL